MRLVFVDVESDNRLPCRSNLETKILPAKYRVHEWSRYCEVDILERTTKQSIPRICR